MNQIAEQSRLSLSQSGSPHLDSHGGPFPGCLYDHHMDGMKDRRNGCVFVPNGLGPGSLFIVTR
jgi:hypothetical protein